MRSPSRRGTWGRRYANYSDCEVTKKNGKGLKGKGGVGGERGKNTKAFDHE